MATSTEAMGGRSPANLKPEYIYEAPVRIWHWVHAISIVVLCVTGYLIGNPLPSVPGEASESFLMGNIRMIHFIAGYVFTIGLLVRIYWGFVGNKYSRELLYLPVWKGSWWKELFHEIKYYSFLTRKTYKTKAHNPLAQSAMWFFNFILGLFMVITGFALYAQGLGEGSWADVMFGWVFVLFPNSMGVKTWHNFGMWLIIVFAIIHTYMAIRADLMGRQSSVSTIMSGWRFYKDDYPGDEPR